MTGAMIHQKRTDMSKTKAKLRSGQPALGGWIMIGHPSVAEIMAGEGFDWIGVDLEHTSTSMRDFHEIALALKGTGCDLLARLHSCDPVLAKLVLDAGAHGIIVPSVNTPDLAAQSVAMARFPPAGMRGASLCRATDFGRNFASYFQNHNDEVLVVVMLEHQDAVARADAILATPGIDAALIGPYDLSASMGLAGQLSHPNVLQAQQTILESCARHKVAPGIHVVAPEADEVARRINQGFRFIACGLDTLFIQQGCRTILGKP
jgi:2-dehydro-3-deoxyglucarate aldolase